MTLNRKELLWARMEKARLILKQAQSLILEGYSATPGTDETTRLAALGTTVKTSHKDLVTIYDKKVEAFLTDALQKAFPGDGIVGEEATAGSGRKAFDIAAPFEKFWLMDPIDGTTNYSRSYPFFASTIAYVERDKNGKPELLVGLVFEPVKDEMFAAVRGGGAWLGRTQLKISSVSDPEKALLSTGFASERASNGDRSFDLFKRLTKSTLGVRRDGSAALDLSYVACGRTDAYWEWGLQPWDTAAGVLLVNEAGGKVTHHDGGEIDLFTGEVVSSNGFLHKWLQDELKID